MAGSSPGCFQYASSTACAAGLRGLGVGSVMAPMVVGWGCRLGGGAWLAWPAHPATAPRSRSGGDPGLPSMGRRIRPSGLDSRGIRGAFRGQVAAGSAGVAPIRRTAAQPAALAYGLAVVVGCCRGGELGAAPDPAGIANTRRTRNLLQNQPWARGTSSSRTMARILDRKRAGGSVETKTPASGTASV